MLPMQMLDLHRRVQMTLEVTAEDMSQYLYLESRAGEESVPGSAAGDEAEQLESYKGILAQILAEGYLRNRILSVDGAQRISSWTCRELRLWRTGSMWCCARNLSM